MNSNNRLQFGGGPVTSPTRQLFPIGLQWVQKFKGKARKLRENLMKQLGLYHVQGSCPLTVWDKKRKHEINLSKVFWVWGIEMQQKHEVKNKKTKTQGGSGKQRKRPSSPKSWQLRLKSRKLMGQKYMKR